jgi:cell division protein FtsB
VSRGSLLARRRKRVAAKREEAVSMSTIPTGAAPTEPKETFVYEAAPLPRWIYVALVVLVLLVGYLFYAGYTAQDKLQTSLTAATNQEAVLSAEIDQSNSRVADLRAKLEVTSQKLGLTQDELARASTLAQSIKQEQKASDDQLAAQIGQVQQQATQQIGAVSTDLSGTKTDLSATKQDLAATKAQLSTAVGDLGVQSGLIAHNEGEVQELQRLNQRNIFQFNIKKAKAATRVGPIQVKLESMDPKRNKYTITVVADDRSTEKKDKTAEEPVQFYVKGATQPYEIVVFDVAKDHIAGYLSTPKEGSVASTPPATSTQ